MEEKSSERVMDGSPRIAFPPQDNETNIKIPPKGPTTDSKTHLDFNKFSQAFVFFGSRQQQDCWDWFLF